MRAVLFLATLRWLLGDRCKRCFGDLRQLFPTQEASTSLNYVKEDDQVRETARARRKGIAALRGGRTRTFNPTSVRDELRVGMEFKQLTASQFCRERAFQGCNPENLGLKKTTTFTTSARHGGVRLLAFRRAMCEHLLEPSAVLRPKQTQETTERLVTN